MQQQVTLQLSTKTITKLMVGMVLAVPAAILLTLAIMVPSIAKADTQQGGSQTANSNPSFNVPAGYVVVPANSNVCANTGSGSAGTVGSGAVVPVAFSSVLPTNYTSTTTQTQTNTNTTNTNTSTVYDHSFNTHDGDTNSNNGNNSNNDNNNTTNSNNPVSTVVTTTTTTNTTSNQNVGNTNNSNNSDSVVNSDDAINAVIHDSFNNNTI